MTVHGENLVKLRALTDKHKMVASLLAQGLGRTEIASIVDFTPEYVTWLARDPLFKAHLQDMSAVVDARYEAMYGLTADTVADAMLNGTVEDKLKGARLQLELTGRIGKNDRPVGALENSLERLNTLAQRLLALQSQVRKGETFEGEYEDATSDDVQNQGERAALRDDSNSQGQFQAGTIRSESADAAYVRQSSATAR